MKYVLFSEVKKAGGSGWHTGLYEQLLFNDFWSQFGYV